MQRGSHLVLLYLLACAPIAHAGETSMTLDSVPSGAIVEMGGSVIGTTPLTRSYPTAFFQSPKTVWAHHLGAPLVFNFRKAGFVDKPTELGEGPNSWVSLNGSNRFDFYLLRTSCTIRLERQKAATPAGGLSYVEKLRALVKLRDDGIISDAEFAAKRGVLLGLGAPVPELTSSPQPSSTD